ncbi:transglycosylase domain-containing protein [Pseudomonas stutzeri]|nr:transglycosylase domain-containing protein [Stutzerimonas stutzeri]
MDRTAMGAPEQSSSAVMEAVVSPERHKDPSLSRRRIWRVRGAFTLALLAAAAGAGWLAAREARTSEWQSRLIADWAATLRFQVEPGPSDAIRYPTQGPFDLRLGYVGLPEFIRRLEAQGFVVERQARFSPPLMEYTGHGLYPPYREKTHAGLDIADCRGEPMFGFRHPQRHYARFADIPPLAVASLLFIENRHLLDERQPHQNPAVDWPRFSMAAWTQLASKLNPDTDTAGGSTLATQIEKFRHSPEGRTPDAPEKLRQMLSASVRAYRDGRETLPLRRQIVHDYINSVPLSAAIGYGEVHGLGDGLWVWFGADFAQTNRALAGGEGITLAEQGLALRQVLALMIAQRRPSWYLAGGRAELAELTDSHLRVLANAGVISPALRDAALARQLSFRNQATDPALPPVASDKGINAIRTRLVRHLGLPLYDLDRLDLSVDATINQPLQQAVSEYLGKLADPAFAAEVGLFGERLLSPELTADVRYSFTLFERGANGNRVRVQTDTTGQPFDINEGSKLELGSTAKLRVLATYLEMVAELHERHAGKSPAELRELYRAANERDNLSRWALDWLRVNPQASLAQMLDAALERKYSASPGETFFTGGGAHTFSNFRREDNGRIATVRESLRESLNLPFVRLLRDLARYSTYQMEDSAQLLSDDKDPRRLEYLARFADKEGTVFLQRFWRKYRDKPPQEMFDTLVEGLRLTPPRLAAIHRYLYPQASLEEFAQVMETRLGKQLMPPPKRLEELYQRYRPGAFDLPDQGYIARVHPLELWLIGYRLENPQADFSSMLAASRDERQEVYGWLFKTRHRSARDSRIRTMVEVEAFTDLQQRWARLGFPFEHMVPSLASALGSSGDRPAALAELMGIIQNDGIRLPTVRIDNLDFAIGTPYETRMVRRQTGGERVMHPEVAAALRSTLADVVENGTARRLKGVLMQADGRPMQVGGKTGTGDNRIETVTRSGWVTSSTARNRTATFVFFLGPRHFGTLTAYVSGEQSARFRFTSALPVQTLKGMMPMLQPYLLAEATACQPPEREATARQRLHAADARP